MTQSLPVFVAPMRPLHRFVSVAAVQPDKAYVAARAVHLPVQAATYRATALGCVAADTTVAVQGDNSLIVALAVQIHVVSSPVVGVSGVLFVAAAPVDVPR
ncbi:Uncharacterised protein [Yersinia massiliensis]|nr:Uncharacterised protein [Yersinia massiliensis]